MQPIKVKHRGRRKEINYTLKKETKTEKRKGEKKEKQSK